MLHSGCVPAGAQPIGVKFAVNESVLGETGENWVTVSVCGVGEIVRPVQTDERTVRVPDSERPPSRTAKPAPASKPVGESAKRLQ